MFKITALFILFVGIVSTSELYSQELSSKSKKAIRAFEAAENAYRLQDYKNAESFYKQSLELDPGFFEAWVMLGELYEKTKDDSSAVQAYRKAVSIDSVTYPSAFYFLAELEYSNGWYVDALDHFEKFLSFEKVPRVYRSNGEKHILNCRFAIEAIKNPVPFDPINLGPNVNTDLNEYFPCLTADNQTLLFTRLLYDKASFTGRQEDFYTSSRYNNEWLPARNIGPPINTYYNEGAPTLSVDGNVLIFTACESVNGYGANRSGYGRCDLFISGKNGDNWSAPQNLGIPVSSRHWESQPSLSADGRTLYFVSNREDDYDIFFTVQDDQGIWSEPEMLGGNINTEGYEGSVFIHPDNQTLYFSSDGHIGMGGMDIYYTRRDSLGNWGEPVNLGYPINTHKDENSILISSDGSLAMFASDRDEGYGGLDLYGFELYEEARPQFVTYMKGTVFEANSGKKLKARFELTDLQTGELVVRSFSNEGNGEFIVCLPTNRDYALNVSKEGYLFYSENFNLSGVHSTTDPFLKDIPLKPIKAGEKVVLRNIFFETDKYDLKSESRVELQKLIDLLTRNPSLMIEISGHTDNVGTSAYNQELSQNRAKAVNDYLVDHGIDQARLLYKGYGELEPIDTNETKEGRANNRRTEFKVIKDI
ncbi:MAG: OmpA family protein [Bacteroidetes bacterium]|nr:OmpA family protein [Bacteroidota bacterium]